MARRMSLELRQDDQAPSKRSGSRWDMQESLGTSNLWQFQWDKGWKHCSIFGLFPTFPGQFALENKKQRTAFVCMFRLFCSRVGCHVSTAIFGWSKRKSIIPSFCENMNQRAKRGVPGAAPEVFPPGSLPNPGDGWCGWFACDDDMMVIFKPCLIIGIH